MASREYGRMSEDMKLRIADQLGFGAQVRQEGGFGSVPARECGNMVKRAIQIAEQGMANGTIATSAPGGAAAKIN